MRKSICSQKYFFHQFYVYRSNIIFVPKFKIWNMKKIILAALSLLLVTAVLSSCGSSRKSGCPMNERIIH